MKTNPRRSIIKKAALLATALIIPAIPINALAQNNKTLKIIVGFPAGGGTDIIARILAKQLSEKLKRNVIVENIAGAGGQIAAQKLKRSKPDGNTVFLSHDHTISILPQVIKNAGYDVEKDFTPVAGFANFVNAFAINSIIQAENLNDYIKWIKENNNSQNKTVGIPAPASTPEFLTSLLSNQFKLDLSPAPYKGSAPMMADLLHEQIPAAIASMAELVEQEKAGKVRVLAVLGNNRQKQMPNVPTFEELGVKGLTDRPYYGIWAPKGTDPAFIKQFSEALNQITKTKQVRTKLEDLGLEIEQMDAQKLNEREKAYTKAWNKIIKETGFKPL